MLESYLKVTSTAMPICDKLSPMRGSTNASTLDISKVLAFRTQIAQATKDQLTRIISQTIAND